MHDLFDLHYEIKVLYTQTALQSVHRTEVALLSELDYAVPQDVSSCDASALRIADV